MADTASTPQRILHLASNHRWTGVAEPATSLVCHQRESGCQVWIACIWGYTFEERLRSMGVPLAESLDLRRLINPLSTRRQIRTLRAFILDHGIQVVHTHLLHDHWLAALAVRPLPLDKRPLLVRTIHRHEVMRRDPWNRWLFERLTDLVITVSQEQSDLVTKGYPAAVGKLRVIHGGVNPDQFSPDPAGGLAIRADMGERPETMIAGIVAHLGYNRGHKWLLEAATKVVEALPEAVIWIIGQGELKKWLRAELSKPRYRGRVLLAGYRTTDLVQTYSAINVGLLLGLGSEGSARAALEAMSCSRPVIAIRKGALTETITDGVDGFLIPDNDVEALAGALIRLLGDPDLCREMGEAARRTILSGFTEEVRAVRTMEAYVKRLGARTPNSCVDGAYISNRL